MMVNNTYSIKWLRQRAVLIMKIIDDFYRNKLTQKDIALKYNVTPSFVSFVIKNNNKEDM